MVKKWNTNVNAYLEMNLITGLEMKSNPKNETGKEKPFKNGNEQR